MLKIIKNKVDVFYNKLMTAVVFAQANDHADAMIFLDK